MLEEEETVIRKLYKLKINIISNSIYNRVLVIISLSRIE